MGLRLNEPKRRNIQFFKVDGSARHLVLGTSFEAQLKLRVVPMRRGPMAAWCKRGAVTVEANVCQWREYCKRAARIGLKGEFATFCLFASRRLGLVFDTMPEGTRTREEWQTILDPVRITRSLIALQQHNPPRKA